MKHVQIVDTRSLKGTEVQEIFTYPLQGLELHQQGAPDNYSSMMQPGAMTCLETAFQFQQ